MGIKVFVYGSLKRNFFNHNRYLKGSKFLGEYVTPPKYTMVDMGYYPGVIREGHTPIKGEVYEVGEDIIERLDELEGHPNFYEREEIKAGKYGVVWMYFLNPNMKGSCPEINDGEWKECL